jgi:hypothetical protein
MNKKGRNMERRLADAEIEVTPAMLAAAEAFIEDNWYPEFPSIPVEFVLSAFQAIFAASNADNLSKSVSA